MWCIVNPEGALNDINAARKWVTFTFTWIYVATQQVWVVFVVVLFFSPLAKIKLGKEDDEPEYPTLSWFMMIFSAGMRLFQS